MLLGIWKNIKELEEELSLAELGLVLEAAREKEVRHNKFMAAINGVKMDDGPDTVDRVEEIKRRVEARQSGVSAEELDFADMGFSYQTE